MSIFSPEYAQQIFNNLDKVPEWYRQAYVVLTFSAWGIAVSKETIASMFANMMSDWRLRRNVKTLAKSVETSKQVFYESLTNSNMNITPKQAKKIEKALDKATKVVDTLGETEDLADIPEPFTEPKE